MPEKTQREKDIEYHEVFMRQLKFYLFGVGHNLEKSVFRAHEETWLELAQEYSNGDAMEEAHNQPPPDKCLFTDSDEEDNSPKKNDKLRSSRSLKALKEIIDELNKSVEVLQKENNNLRDENSELTEKINNIKSVISG